MCEKENSLQYYKKYIEKPDLPRPLEPCNDFEHPIRWANLAYWEKARADRMAAQHDELLAALKTFVAIPYTHDDGCHPSSGRHSKKCKEVKNALLMGRALIEKIEAGK